MDAAPLPRLSHTAAIVLAAGQGTRMRSRLPKVLHRLFGEPMLVHVLRAAKAAGCEGLVVVASPSTRAAIEAAIAHEPFARQVRVAVQEQARGTGDAARAGLTAVDASFREVLVVCGDTPMLSAGALTALRAARQDAPVAVLGCELADPTGYGRIRLGRGHEVLGIVEHKDASEAERQIKLVNSGVYAADAAFLRLATAALKADNAQGEYYLTDVVAAAAAHSRAALSVLPDPDEARGVNSRVDLADVGARWQAAIVRRHQLAGVTIASPATAVIGPSVVIEPDVTIGHHVQLLGRTLLASEATVEGPSIVADSEVAAHAHVRPFCHFEGAKVGERAVVGPYARLRPGADIGAGARVGNFVEVKAATLGEGAKVNHLAYVGDAHIGAQANVGAGTIFCNYDGFQKHQTHVGERAFVGSNATLVAPLSIGAGAIVAAGSTLTEDVPADALAFGRAKQSTLPERARALREKLARAKKGLST